MPIKFSTLPVSPRFAQNEWEFLSFRSLEGRPLEAVKERENRTMGWVVAALLPLLLLSKRRAFCPSGEETRFLSFTIFPPKVVSRDKRDTQTHKRRDGRTFFFCSSSFCLRLQGPQCMQSWLGDWFRLRSKRVFSISSRNL